MVEVKKILLVSKLELFIDLLILSIISPQMEGNIPVLADSEEQMRGRILRWSSEIEIEVINESESNSARNKVEELLGINVTNWGDLDVKKIYKAILKKKGYAVNNGNYIIAFKEEPKSAILAAIRAAFEARPFEVISSNLETGNGFVDLRKGSKPINSVYIFTELLNQKKLYWVYKEIGSLSFITSKKISLYFTPFGFLNASSFSMMTFIDLKQKYSIKSDLTDGAILPSLQSPISLNNSNFTIFNRSTAALETVRDTDFRLFSLTAHGRSDLSFIGQDYLCGMSDSISTDNCRDNKKVPMCMKPPYQCLRTEGKKLRINELACKHMLVNSCGSLGLSDSEFGEYFNLSYTALEGKAESYIGTARWKDGDIHESFLYLYALNSGYTLGETTMLLNKALQFNRYENEDNIFVLLGDPSYTVIVNNDLNENFEPMKVNGTYIKSTLKYSFQQVFFQGKDISEACRNGCLNIKLNGISEGFCTAIPALENKNEGVLILIMSPYNQNLPCEYELFLSIGCSELNEAIEVYQELSVQHNSVLRINKFYPTNLIKGKINDIDNKILNIISRYKESYIKPHLMLKIVKDIKKFYDNVESVDKITSKYLYEMLNNTNFRFAEHYSQKFLLSERKVPMQVCYMCGQQVVTRSQFSIVNTSSHRDEYICMNCGGIEDKPDNDLSIEIKTGEVTNNSSNEQITLTIINNTNKEQRGFGCIAVRNSARWNLKIEPEFTQYIIKPFGSVSHTYNISLGMIPPHKHTLQAVFVKNQKVYLGMRPFRVIYE